MPIKDPVRRAEVHKAWVERRMKEGYGKALYTRRKKRFENEETLRAAVRDALAILAAPGVPKHFARDAVEITRLLTEALERAPEVTGKPLDFMPDNQ